MFVLISFLTLKIVLKSGMSESSNLLGYLLIKVVDKCH